MSQRPFSSGGDYMSWTNRNCVECAKRYTDPAGGWTGKWNCDLEQALSKGAITDGTIPDPIAVRLGCTEENLGYPATRCPEFQEVAP